MLALLLVVLRSTSVSWREAFTHICALVFVATDQGMPLDPLALVAR